MSVRAIHEIAAVLLGCLSGYVTLIHLSTPALRGVRWVAIAYFSATIGIVLRQESHSNPSVVLGHLLISFLGIAFYWGLAQLLHKKRLNLWLLFFLVPVLLGQIYFLYVDPQTVPRAILFHAIIALQALSIVDLLLRSRSRETLFPRIGLSLLFLFWGGLQIFIACSSAFHNHNRTLAYEMQVDGRFVLLPLLPAVLVCLGFLWLAMTQLQNELEHQSNTDVLTGLLNRRALQRAATRAIAHARRRNSPLTLVLLDLDHFKDINDRHGHAAGDSVLVAIARRLEAVLRERDLVVRWGGEEFLVMVATMPVSEAVALAQRLMKAFVDAPVVVDGQAIEVSASIGFAVFPLVGRSPGHAFDMAFALVDAAMYHSKSQGRACATCIVSLDAELPLEPSSVPATLAHAAADGRALLAVHRTAGTVSSA